MEFVQSVMVRTLQPVELLRWVILLGIIAAQSIGEPGTQLTLRTFHVGGIASVSQTESEITAKHAGIIEFDGIRITDIKEDGTTQKVVLSRTGEIRIVEPKTGRVLSSNHIPYGSNLKIEDKQEIKKGEVICDWDPFNAVIISRIFWCRKF
jgi:DNA-directed RNA polymerase subunit beta'